MDVCFAYMPPAAPLPSLGLSILKASLMGQGISSNIIYANLDNLYYKIALFENRISSAVGETGLGEQLFSNLTGIASAKNNDEYFEWLKAKLPKFSQQFAEKDFNDYLQNLRICAGEIVEKTAQRVISEDPKILAVSSMFYQINSSLALMKRVKELKPDIVTIMGGASINADKTAYSLVQTYHYLDYAIVGEGEEIFPLLCKKLILNPNIERRELPYGVVAKGNISTSELINSMQIEDLDNVCCPDYTDYVNQYSNYEAFPGFEWITYYDSTRGCVWAAANGCTFCSLNGSKPTYRIKTPEKVILDLKLIEKQTGKTYFFMTDNYLSDEVAANLLPKIIESDLKYQFHWSTRCDLSPSSIRLMSESGTVSVQAGLESLSQSALTHMQKGTSVLQNIFFLKKMKDYSINTEWNYLYGFPGEDQSWYYEAINIIPLITHLQPPIRLNKLKYNRYSSYFKNQAKYSINLKPHPHYYFCFPDTNGLIGNLCGLFVDINTPEERVTQIQAFIDLKKMLLRWKSDHSKRNESTLKQEFIKDQILITDTREIASNHQYLLSVDESSVYMFCNEIRSISEIEHKFPTIQQSRIEAIVCKLCELNILINQRGHLLSIANV